MVARHRLPATAVIAVFVMPTIAPYWALVVDDPVAATQITTARLEEITPTTNPSIASPSPHRPWTGGAGLL